VFDVEARGPILSATKINTRAEKEEKHIPKLMNKINRSCHRGALRCVALIKMRYIGIVRARARARTYVSAFIIIIVSREEVRNSRDYACKLIIHCAMRAVRNVIVHSYDYPQETPSFQFSIY